MNRPRESLLTLFDPLFSSDPTTPPACRDAPSPDLGSDKENAAPAASDSSLTLTKFFNRIYMRPKAQRQTPQPLPKGRLIDHGDPNASYDAESDADAGSDSDSDDEAARSEHVFVVHRRRRSSSVPTGSEEADGEGEGEGAVEEAAVCDVAPRRRPLVDIALGDSRSSRRGSPPAVAKGASASPFGSPSPFRLARPTPAPTSSPLASVINAINRTASSPSPSPSPSPPLTPSAPRIAVIPAEPSSPSPTRRQPRPGAMLHASPEADAGAESRRTSVDLQEALSVHFDDESSFDLLKDKISLPENDSLGDLDMDMRALAIAVVPEKESSIVMPLSADDAESESEGEPDFGGLLEERLRDMKIGEDDDAVVPAQGEDGNGRDCISTPPAQFSSCDVPTPQAPVRQFLRPGHKTQVSLASITSHAPPALQYKRGARASISGLAMPTSTAALRITKKAKPDIPPAAPAPVAGSLLLPGRKTAGGGGTTSSSSSHSHAAARSAPRVMELGGVQRPPAPTKATAVAVAVVRAAPPSAASARVQPQPQRNKPMATQAHVRSKTTVPAAAEGGLRPSGLRPPMSRMGASGIAVPRRASVAGGGGATRSSMAVGGGGRLGGSSAVARMGLAKVDGASAAARMMRRA